jgi:hypothetical protein
LIPTALWRSGPVEAGVEVVEATVLLLSHLAWGNLVSVAAPFKMQFYRWSSNGSLLTVMAGTTIGSAPGVAVLFLLQSSSLLAPVAIAAILVLVFAVYVATLHHAGRNVERQWSTMSERLS